MTVNIIIRNEPNNCLTRYGSELCGGIIEKQAYLFEVAQGVPGVAKAGDLVCDECAEHPEDIPTRMREEAAHQRQHVTELRTLADSLEAAASRCEFTTEVVPVDDETAAAQDGMYSPDEWPNWMRERIGLPALTIDDRDRLFEARTGEADIARRLRKLRSESPF